MVSSEQVISANSLAAAVDDANQAKTMAEKRKYIIGVNKPAIMARLRDRVTVMENDIARLYQQLRSGASGGSEPHRTEFLTRPRTRQELSQLKAPPPGPDPNPLVANGPPKRINPGSRLIRRRPPAENEENGESENPAENLDYENFKTGNYKYQKMKMRYSRRYANYLPYRLGTTLIDGMPDQLKSQVDVPRVQCYGWNMSGVHYLKPRHIPAPVILVREKLARHLLTYFFENINPLFSILHRPMFMEQFDAYLLTPDKKECRLFMAMFHAACAIAIRFCETCDNEQFEEGLEEKLFDDAYDTLQAFTFEWESLEIVQGYLLLTLYLRACHRQPSAWGTLGTAIRMASGMGLMHRIQVNTFTSDYDILKHERVFWACFVMDRTFCMESGRHFSFREDEISVAIPHYFIDDGWQTPISNALLRLCLSLGDLVYDSDLALNTDDLKNIKSRLMAWNDSMKEFKLDGDTDLGRFKLPAALLAHFRLCYYNNLFFIHMRMVFGLVGIQWEAPQMDPRLYISCVQGVVAITSELSELGQLKTPWWLALSTLYHAGVVALLLVYNQISALEMGKALTKIIALMTEISNDGRFIMAKECVWSLKTLNHMMYLKISQARDLLDSAGMDHGPATINKGNFSSMGVLDSEGNESLPVLDAKREAADQNPNGNGQPFQPVTFTASTDFPDISPGSSANDPLESLEWFQNWSWDVNTANIDFFGNTAQGS